MAYRNKCLGCYSFNLNKIIDLGSHSFADRFIDKEIIDKADPAYNLSCSICKECGFIQNNIKTNPEDRYVEIDYSYTASNSKYSINHWNEYASKVIQFHQGNISSILEIGSNDGTLLKAFKILDTEFLLNGIDASPKMIKLCKDNGIDAYLDIFGSNDNIGYLNNKKYDLIIANNVLNHSESPKEFLSLAKTLLKDRNSIIVYELPYWKCLVDDKRFDQIYHEHVSYFTIHNSKCLLESIGLEINHIEVNNYHGGSLRVYCSKEKSRLVSESVNKLLEEELKSKLMSDYTYEDLVKKIKQNKILIVKKILDANLNNRDVICIGAAAKANTLLSYYGLDRSIVSFITDSSEYKIGKYTPLTRIPILPDEAIKDLKNPLCLITSWNIGEILRSKILDINPSAEIILPHLSNP